MKQILRRSSEEQELQRGDVDVREGTGKYYKATVVGSGTFISCGVCVCLYKWYYFWQHFRPHQLAFTGLGGGEQCTCARDGEFLTFNPKLMCRGTKIEMERLQEDYSDSDTTDDGEACCCASDCHS